MSNNPLLVAALSYHRRGLCALPAKRAEKRPDAGLWSRFKTERPTEPQLRVWFSPPSPPDAICLVGGKSSGGLEILDFDVAGELFLPWKALVDGRAPGLVDRIPRERSINGGYHLPYLVAEPVPGSMTLARRLIHADGPEQIIYRRKPYTPTRGQDGRWYITVTLIETKGQGGIIICAPTQGYEVIHSDLAAPPTISPQERDILLTAAWELDEMPAPAAPSPQPIIAQEPCGRPGDDFNQRGDVRPYLLRHGWQLLRDGDNSYWRRPGKSRGNHSATLKNGVFFIFSSSAHPFEPGRSYGPFHTYALLEHGGNFSAAASALAELGFGAIPDDTDVDLSSFLAKVPNRSGRKE